MFTLKQVLILALAGITVALPHGDFAGGYPGRHGRNRDKLPTSAVTDDNTVIVTVYPDGTIAGIEGGDYDDDDSAPAAQAAAPEAPAAPAAPVVPAAQAAAPVAPVADASAGTQTGYMAIVAKYRAAGGLQPLVQDAQLQTNAQNTANAQAGDGTMNHILNGGTMAQVLAPGKASEFEHVYLGGWLCEIPTLPGLNGACATASQGWSYQGQTGHAKILTDPKYKKIGCALGKGIWSCDLA